MTITRLSVYSATRRRTGVLRSSRCFARSWRCGFSAQGLVDPMCELVAMSSRRSTRLTFSLEILASHSGRTGRFSDGWGAAFYQDNDVALFREPIAASNSSPFASSKRKDQALRSPSRTSGAQSAGRSRLQTPSLSCANRQTVCVCSPITGTCQVSSDPGILLSTNTILPVQRTPNMPLCAA